MLAWQVIPWEPIPHSRNSHSQISVVNTNECAYFGWGDKGVFYEIGMPQTNRLKKGIRDKKRIICESSEMIVLIGRRKNCVCGQQLPRKKLKEGLFTEAR